MSCPECNKQPPARGSDIATPQVISKRRQVCQSCQHADIKNASQPSWASFSACRLCNCNIADKTKRLRAVCPDQPPRW